MGTYRTKVERPTVHPRLGRLEPGQILTLDDERAAQYADRKDEVPKRDPESGERIPNPEYDKHEAAANPDYDVTPYQMQARDVEGIIERFEPEKISDLEALGREDLDRIARTLSIEPAQHSNKGELAKALAPHFSIRSPGKEKSEG